MCGICGLVSLRGESIDPAPLAAMNGTLVHRGPDSDGSLLDGPVGLAMRRLSIIDLAGGDQPIANEDRSVWVIQNGEIYNHRALREGLEGAGHRFRTASDTEVLVHLYEERGPRFVEELRGMFALAIWDTRERRLLLARDRFGIKPLYYSRRAGMLSFASELKALLAQPGFPRELDPDALELYLSLGVVTAPHTIFSAARKLPAGHTLTWSERRPEETAIERYARPRPVDASAVRREDERELAEELRERLADSVRAHLVADVPVGVLLSGGVDSCSLAALAARESPGTIKTFSIGFPERSFNEFERARLVAERYGTDHHELVVRPDAVDLLPRIVAAFDEPFADSSALPTYLVSQLAATEVKVALAGEGGDELFGGYNIHVAARLAPFAGRVAGALAPLIERLPSSTRAAALDDKAKRFARAARLEPADRHHAWREVFSAAERRELLGPARHGGLDPASVHRTRYRETHGAATLARVLDLDLGIYLVDDLLVKTDRASMAHSLEVRVPFLDTAVAELALALPDGLKVRGLSRKRLLRKAVEPLLPEEILTGPKRGFSIPAAAWLRGELQPLVRELLSPAEVARQGYFDPAAVTRVIEEHVSGRANRSRHLWTLLCFAVWAEGLGGTGRSTGP